MDHTSNLEYIPKYNHTRFERVSNPRLEMEGSGNLYNPFSRLLGWFINLFFH